MKRPAIRKFAVDSGISADDQITNDAILTLRGTSAAGAIITIKDKGKVLGTVKADASGHWHFTTKPLADGKHKFVAKAALNSETSGWSAPCKATIDTKAPIAPGLTLDSASDRGSSPVDRITADTMPTLAGIAEPHATITIRDGGTVIGSATAGSSGQWSFTSQILGDGGHSLTATASDAAGNVSAASGALSVVIDTVAPAPSTPPDLAAASDTGSSSTDNIASDPTPSFTGTAEAGSTVRLYDGVTEIGSAVADGGGTWTITSFDARRWRARPHGDGERRGGQCQRRLGRAERRHRHGGAGAATPPDLAAASDTGSSSTDNTTSEPTPSFTGTAEAGSTVRLFDGVTEIGSTVADGGGAWTITSSTLGDGGHSLTATASDAAGNVSAASGGAERRHRHGGAGAADDAGPRRGVGHRVVVDRQHHQRADAELHRHRRGGEHGAAVRRG